MPQATLPLQAHHYLEISTVLCSVTRDENDLPWPQVLEKEAILPLDSWFSSNFMGEWTSLVSWSCPASRLPI